MRCNRFQLRSELPFPAPLVFSWLSQQYPLPPWLKSHEKVSDSSIHTEMHRGIFHCKWLLERKIKNFTTTTFQQQGPFAFWQHWTRVQDLGENSALEDEVFYSLSKVYPWIDRWVPQIVQYQQEKIKRDLAIYQSYPKQPKRILLSGASGLVGRAIADFCRLAGHQVVVLRREGRNQDSIVWDPGSGNADIQDFEGFDAVIHLAGENIAKGFWTERKKKRIFQSRSRDTWLLSQLFCRVKHPPKVFLGASAVGIYGNRSEVLDESSSPGSGFLADVCMHWEKATQSMEERGIRVVHARLGYVLSAKGGLLSEMLPLFRLGLGGKIGKGDQMMPWVSLEDVVGAFYHLLQREEIVGAVNIVSPGPVSQALFAKKLGNRLHRPCFATIPSWCLLGEKARELLLSSACVLPKKLIETGYVFSDPTLDSVLERNIPLF